MPAPLLVVREASLADPVEARAVVDLVDGYARKSQPGGLPLSVEVSRGLVPGLAAHPTSLVLLAWRGEEAVGIAVCFRGFSTWSGRPLLNLHDLAVRQEHRRAGVGRRLLAAVEERALALGCCRITLEVRGDNRVAQGLYRSVGFVGGAGAPGEALGGRPEQTFFWEKPLP